MAELSFEEIELETPLEVPAPETKATASGSSTSAMTGAEAALEEKTEPTPECACAYCGLFDPACVVKCVESNKWFCNSAYGSPASHIISHLVRSKHNKVRLHAESPLGDTMLECYHCGNTNCFVLGFVPAKTESVVVLLCRICVETVHSLKSLDWDLSEWVSLIADKRFLTWLVREPASEIAKLHVVPPVAKQHQLEELWKTKSDATFDDLEHQEALEEEAQSTCLVYSDGYHLQNILAPLVKQESEYDRKNREAQRKEGISVRWERGLSKKNVAIFSLQENPAAAAFESSELRLLVGDELKLKLDKQGVHQNGGRPWEGIGQVLRVSDGEIAMELKWSLKSSAVPSDVTDSVYSVDFVWKGTSYERMQSALKTLAVDDTSVSGYLYHRLLGHDVEPQAIKLNGSLTSGGPSNKIPGLPELNHSQQAAVKAVIQQPLSLIQGPPGTGKTVTSAAIIYNLAKQNAGQVLVVAPSNIAVDQLTAKIHATGLKVVRLASKAREVVVSSVDHLSLHVMLRAIDTPELEELRKLQRLKDDQGELAPGDLKRFRKLYSQTGRVLLQAADVICTTCVGAGDRRLAQFRFRQVLIDEATQANEPESLIPIVLGAKQLVMVGDHQQLGPVIKCKTAAKAGLTQSLYERLVALGIRPIRLEVQYRSHPRLSEFPSSRFYEGSLQNGVSESERTMSRLAAGEDPEFPWPSPDTPMLFYDCNGSEEMSGSGTSFLNRSEASAIEKIVTFFLKAGLEPGQIGVITPYEGQRAYVCSHMIAAGPLRSASYDEIEVASVDSFQGREKDIIVLSCVRSNDHQGIGFLNDPRRLNVALTRARFGLVIVGNCRVLAQDPLWNALLTHFKAQHCIAEGPLNNLKESTMTLPRPRVRAAPPSIYNVEGGGYRGGVPMMGGGAGGKATNGFGPMTNAERLRRMSAGENSGYAREHLGHHGSTNVFSRAALPNGGRHWSDDAFAGGGGGGHLPHAPPPPPPRHSRGGHPPLDSRHDARYAPPPPPPGDGFYGAPAFPPHMRPRGYAGGSGAPRHHPHHPVDYATQSTHIGGNSQVPSQQFSSQQFSSQQFSQGSVGHSPSQYSFAGGSQSYGPGASQQHYGHPNGGASQLDYAELPPY